MAGRHNLSSVWIEQLQYLAKAREVNPDNQQSLVTKNHKDSPTHHHSHQPIRDEAKCKEEHKIQIEIVNEKQSWSIHQKAEESWNTQMAPKGKKSMATKLSPKKVIRWVKEIKDESLKERLERILSAKPGRIRWRLKMKYKSRSTTTKDGIKATLTKHKQTRICGDTHHQPKSKAFPRVMLVTGNINVTPLLEEKADDEVPLMRSLWFMPIK